jgi:hypothetical protein
VAVCLWTATPHRSPALAGVTLLPSPARPFPTSPLSGPAASAPPACPGAGVAAAPLPPPRAPAAMTQTGLPRPSKDLADPVARLAASRKEFGEYGGVNAAIECSTTFTGERLDLR